MYVMDFSKKLVLFSSFVLLGVGCGNQSSIGGSSGEAVNSKPNGKFLGEEQSSYQGSQAYNSSLFTPENVNGNSGSLSISKPLINVPGVTKNIGLSLNLVYSSSSGISAFHMPKGWGLQLSYVIPEQSVNIDGSNYLIDYKWADDSGYKSGLKYMNNHGVKFTNVGTATLKCRSDTLDYKYVYSNSDGGHQYFDASGRLIARTNNFGSCISYHYTSIYNAYNTRLIHIIDSYGQQFDFNYGSNYFTVTYNKKQLAKVYYSSSGVSSYEDAMSYKTYYNYNNDNTPLVNQIKYPSGLTTQIQYSHLSYKPCFGGSVASLPAVSSLIHLSAEVIIDQTDYTYGDATGGHNFTGYKGGYCLGGNQDSLVDSNNYNYSYNVTITKRGDIHALKQVSRVYYNFLHLPIKTDNLDISGKVKSQVLYSYGISPEKHLRSASFGQPIQIENKSEGITTSLVKNTYDEYNHLLTSSTQTLINGKLTAYKNDTASYFKDANYIPAETVENDLIKGSSIRTVNTLNENKTAIADSKTYHNNQPWKAMQFGYDDLGRVVIEKIQWLDKSKLGTKSSQIGYTYSYDNGVLTTIKTDALNGRITIKSSTLLSDGQVLQQISPLGSTINYIYDDNGRETSKIDPMGNKLNTNYSVYQTDGSNSITKTNPLGFSQTVIYDALGRMLVAQDNGGVNDTKRVIARISYTINGQVAAKIDKFGNTTTNDYDEFGRMVNSTDSLNNVTTINYDDINLTTSTYLNKQLVSKEQTDAVKNTLSKTSYSVDNQHSATTMIDYNGFNQKLLSQEIIDGTLDATNNFTYDGDGEVLNSSKTYYDNSKIEVKPSRDLLGNILEQTTTVSNKGIILSNSNSYNEAGQIVSSTNLLKQTKTNNYDQDGRVLSSKDYDGVVTNYTYDKNGHVITSKTGQTTTISNYDAVGHLLSVSESTGTIKYSYTKSGLLQQISYPYGNTTSYAYDRNDLLTSKTDTLGVTTKYSYDSLGRVTSISMANSTLSYKYADKSLVNGQYGELVGTLLTDNGNNLLSHNYTYDSWGQLASDNIKQGNHYIKIELMRNQRQQLVNKSISSDLDESLLNMTQTFEYDAQHHLLSSTAKYGHESGNTTEVKEQFDYDKNGNVTTYSRNQVVNTYAYNDLDQLIAVNGKTIAYDKAGNMLNDLEDNQYSYNELNQLTSVKMKDKTIKYDYWATGLLRKKTNSNNDDYVEFYYDSEGNANAIISVTNQVASQDSFMLEGGKPIVSYRGNHANYYLKAGNSTVGMLDIAGKLTNSYKYDAYGANTSTKSTDPAQSFLWNQEYKDEDTNLVYLRARFYSPELMRFVNADTYPVDNIYNFGNGDPINNIDPSGHFSMSDLIPHSIGQWVGAVAGLIAGIGFGAFGGAGFLVGASVGGAISGASTTIEDLIDDNKKPGRDVAYSTAIGLVLGAAGGLATAGTRRIASRIFSNSKSVIFDETVLVEPYPLYLEEKHVIFGTGSENVTIEPVEEWRITEFDQLLKSGEISQGSSNNILSQYYDFHLRPKDIAGGKPGEFNRVQVVLYSHERLEGGVAKVNYSDVFYKKSGPPDGRAYTPNSKEFTAAGRLPTSEEDGVRGYDASLCPAIVYTEIGCMNKPILKKR